MSEENKGIALELPPQAPDFAEEIKEEVPTLSLNPEEEEKAAEQAAQTSAPYLADANLTEAEKKVVSEFSEKIDLKDSGIVLQYGAAAQKKVSEFADSALQGVKTKDLGEVGNMISDLVTELKGFSVESRRKKVCSERSKRKPTILQN